MESSLKNTEILRGTAQGPAGDASVNRWCEVIMMCSFKPWLIGAVFVWLLCSAHEVLARTQRDEPSPQATAADIEFFEKQIRPILIERCQGCHGDKKQWAGLRLDSREAILVGGDSGPSLVLGDGHRSELLERVGSLDPELRMPPKEPHSLLQNHLMKSFGITN